MRILKPVFWILLIAVGAWAAWNFFFEPPERIIRKRLEKLEAAISQNPGGNIAKVANANRIGTFFHPNVSINLEGFGRQMASIQGRGELEQLALGTRQQGIAFNVHLSNMHIQAQRGETNATALVTVEVSSGDRTEPIVQDVRLSWEQMDGDWVIRSAAPVKALKIE